MGPAQSSSDAIPSFAPTSGARHQGVLKHFASRVLKRFEFPFVGDSIGHGAHQQRHLDGGGRREGALHAAVCAGAPGPVPRARRLTPPVTSRLGGFVPASGAACGGSDTSGWRLRICAACSSPDPPAVAATPHAKQTGVQPCASTQAPCAAALGGQCHIWHIFRPTRRGSGWRGGTTFQQPPGAAPRCARGTAV